MKRLIYQVYVREKSNLYDFCIESVERYCKKYDIVHVVQKEPILKIMPDMSRTNRNKNGIITCGYLPIYEKENAFEYLGQYDQVAIIDADIYIKDNAPNIFEELPEGYSFGGVLERDMPLTARHNRKITGYSKDMFSRLPDVDWKWNDHGAEFFNMGMMVLNKSFKNHLKGQSAGEFIRRPEFKDFVDGMGYWKYSTDQVLLNYFMKKDNVKVKNMDWKWNAMYRGVRDELMKDSYFVHFFLKQELPHKGEKVEALMPIVK